MKNKKPGIKRALNDITLNAITLRTQLLQSMMNPSKQIERDCGYPASISIQEYKEMYDRNGIGARVVELFPQESWITLPVVYETEESEETEFEKTWKILLKEKNIYTYLQNVDILSGVGRFGVLLIGVSDGKELVEPVEGIDERTGEITGKTKYQLLYLRCFDESCVDIEEKENDVTSPRYAQPKKYSIRFEDPTNKDSFTTKTVHWTRVIHIADNRKTSEIAGTPRMKSVWNYLLDVRKTLAGSAEMFWRGGFPGMAFELAPEVTDGVLDQDTVEEQMELYSSGLQRYLALDGVVAKSLAPQVADPRGHLDTQIDAICIALSVPKRIFVGSERGELASSQDAKAWAMRMKRRQDNHITPIIIRPFIDRLIAFGVLPEVSEYYVEWEDIVVPSDSEKMDIAYKKTDAMAKYVAGGVDQLIPPQQFFTTILGMTEEEALAIENESNNYDDNIRERSQGAPNEQPSQKQTIENPENR